MEAEQYFTRSTRKFKEKDSYAMLRSGLQTKFHIEYLGRVKYCLAAHQNGHLLMLPSFLGSLPHNDQIQGGC